MNLPVIVATLNLATFIHHRVDEVNETDILLTLNKDWRGRSESIWPVLFSRGQNVLIKIPFLCFG